MKSWLLPLSLILGLHASSTPVHTQALAINRVETTHKVVALTFDADMTLSMLEKLHKGTVASWYNQAVIDELKKEKIPATLFLTGLWIETYPTVVKELSQNSLFELANHSYSHGAFSSPCYHLPNIPESEDKNEIMKTDSLLQTYGPGYVKLFRFPGLCADADDMRVAATAGYRVISGNILGGDGFQKNTDAIVSNVVDHVVPGSIIILHMNGGPNAPMTAEALPRIIRTLISKGYTFVKVSDLMKI